MATGGPCSLRYCRGIGDCCTDTLDACPLTCLLDACITDCTRRITDDGARVTCMQGCLAGSCNTRWTCPNCQPGSVRSDVPGDCTACPPNTFSAGNSAARATCTPCPANTSTDGTSGAAACTPCPLGSHAPAGSPCSPCPAGTAPAADGSCVPTANSRTAPLATNFCLSTRTELVDPFLPFGLPDGDTVVLTWIGPAVMPAGLQVNVQLQVAGAPPGGVSESFSVVLDSNVPEVTLAGAGVSAGLRVSALLREYGTAGVQMTLTGSRAPAPTSTSEGAVTVPATLWTNPVVLAPNITAALAATPCTGNQPWSFAAGSTILICPEHTADLDAVALTCTCAAGAVVASGACTKCQGEQVPFPGDPTRCRCPGSSTGLDTATGACVACSTLGPAFWRTPDANCVACSNGRVADSTGTACIIAPVNAKPLGGADPPGSPAWWAEWALPAILLLVFGVAIVFSLAARRRRQEIASVG